MLHILESVAAIPPSASPHMMHPGLRAAPEDPHPLSLSLSASCLPPTPACSLLFINPLLLALLSFLSFDSGICYHLALANPFVFPMKWSQKPSALEGHEHLFPLNLQVSSSNPAGEPQKGDWAGRRGGAGGFTRWLSG